MSDQQQITYQEFKAVETNLREAFDGLRRLTVAQRDTAEQLDRIVRLTADLSRRLATMEERNAAASGAPLTTRSGGDRMPPAFPERGT